MAEAITTAKIIKSNPITSKNSDLKFHRDYLSIRYWCPDKNRGDWGFKHKKYSHYPLWRFCLRWLKKKGFMIYIDAEFAKQFACITKSRRWGFSNDLEFIAEIYPAGFSIEFYQNIKFENPHGGQHDFDKYLKLPKRIRLYFEEISNELIDTLIKTHHLKFYDDSNICFPPLTAEQQIIKHERESSFDKYNIQYVPEEEKYMSEYDFKYNSESGIKDIIKCGDKRRFIDYDETIQIGTVYHHINNMWWVIKDKYTLRNIASWQILDKVTDETPRNYDKSHLHLILDRIYQENFPSFIEFLIDTLNRCQDAKAMYELAHKNIEDQDKAICSALNAHSIMISHLASKEQAKAKNMDEYASLYKAKINDETNSSIYKLKQQLQVRS